ncbi:uncharacterized protein [Onthophagus taurus]|uniref:uncharacterized protein n=1 Tax=Onthophagus taurus TaxID=166361 RepID=UPI0039BDEA4C
MKFLIVFAVVSLATLSTCFPGPKKDTDDDVEFIPSARRYNPFGVVDVEANPSGYDDFDDDFPGLTQGWKDSFSAFMKRVTDLVKNVRTQVAKDLEDKLKNGTTTSTVEIINGHKVVKNQTVYEDPHTYVKSVVFEVLPNSDEAPNTGSNPEVDTEAVPKRKDREPLEDSVENEVNALNEAESINIETLGDQSVPPQNFAYKTTDNNNWLELPNKNEKDIELIDSNEISTPDEINKNNPIDLSSDIRVNDILSAEDYPKNPDAEIFEASEPVEIDPIKIKPYDLESDTRVNDILRNKGYPKNPNAEIFEIDVPKLVVT